MSELTRSAIWTSLLALSCGSSMSKEPEAQREFLRAAGIWQQVGFDSGHSGFNSEEATIGAGNVAALSLSFSGSAGRIGTGQPIVASGRVYVPTNRNEIRAFNASTGSHRWTLAGGAFSSPAASNGELYVTSQDGSLRVLNSLDGSLSWTASIGTTLAAPTLAGGVVFVSSFTSGLLAFSALGCDGTMCSPLWRSDVMSGGRTTAAVGGGIVAVTLADADPQLSRLYGYLEAGCGAPVCSPRWSVSLGDLDLSPPVVSSGHVYLTAGDRLLAVNKNTGRVLWRMPVHSTGTAPAVAQGVVFLLETNQFSAFDAVTGARVWHSELTADGAISSPITIANGLVYLASHASNSVIIFETACGTADAQCAPLHSASQPVASGVAVSNGRVYAADGSSTVRAYSP
ncbi:MAG: PQQ-binding-like beta-propeller repeat protein [Myxococcota bacterium]